MRFAHADRYLSGIAFPLSALRGAESPGCGEFPDLATTGDVARSWGLDLIQLLPVNDSGSQTSPYSALSAFALHPLYLRIGDLPELSPGRPAAPGAADAAGSALSDAGTRAALLAEAAALAAAHRGDERVAHEELYRAKLDLLAKVWAAKDPGGGVTGSGGPGPAKAAAATAAPAAAKAAGKNPASRRGGEELDAWLAANPWAACYAAFVELKRRNGESPWWEWDRLRDPTAADIAALWADRAYADELRFWAWVQMRAEAQFRAAAEGLAARGIALMGDIPILMNKDSADVWSRRGSFRLELSAGAPPDMYSSMGQNWGFPIYDWDNLEAEGYGFWTERLREADKYYSSYRIDHVLGFFRIWSLGERESTGVMGRFVPDVPIERRELEALGFSSDRLRWLSRPHVPYWRIVQAAGESAARGAAQAALDRIGEEELFLFKGSIRGEKDIEAIPTLSPAARDFLVGAWRDRALLEFEDGRFVPAWTYRTASCWPTLSDGERAALEGLFARKSREAQELWAATGRRLLGALKAAVPMLPCAEDLGSVPDCVPVVLEELGILGLRVLRWARAWNRPGQPYIPPTEYPRLSVACASVHDSSSLRGWWESEADREATWSLARATLGRDIGPCPGELGPSGLSVLMETLARSNSRIAVYPLQDIIAMSPAFRPADPRAERINVPGTVGAGNWSYRMPVSLPELGADPGLSALVRALARARPAAPKDRA